MHMPLFAIFFIFAKEMHIFCIKVELDRHKQFLYLIK